MGLVRPSLRGNLRRGTADWTSACRAIWISAGPAVVSDRRMSRRRRARFYDSRRQHQTQRKIAGRDCSHRNKRSIRFCRSNRDSLYRCDCIGWPWSRRCKCAGRITMGNVHRRLHDSTRPVHGFVHVSLPQRKNRRGDDHRRHWLAAGRLSRWPGRRFVMGHCIHAFAAQSNSFDGRLWFHRVSFAGLVAALPARLSVVLPEDRNRCDPDFGRDSGASQPANAGNHPVCFRRRAGRARQSLSLRLHHDRLRRD